MSPEYVITVTSQDRVGIVAAVSAAILELDGNIGALSQTVMSGYFTLILTTRFKAGTCPEKIRQAVVEKGRPGELGVLVRAIGTELPTELMPTGDKFIMTISGQDQQGAIGRVTSYLAANQVNIEDLFARSSGDNFLLVAELRIPLEASIECMQQALAGLWPDETLNVSLQHENIFLTTNQIDFSVQPATPAQPPDPQTQTS